MNVTRDELLRLPVPVLEEALQEAKRRKKKYGKQALKVTLRRCFGCKQEFTAKEMRTHECTMNYHRRIGKVYCAKEKKYVWPKA